MYRQDYILRLIEQFGRAFAVLLNKITGRQQVNATDWGTLQAAMFGSPQAGIPAWAGYTIGYRLVSERMARLPSGRPGARRTGTSGDL